MNTVISLFSFFARKKSETMYHRFLRFIEESHRDGVMGDGRYAVALGKAKKLRRFLIIIGQPSMAVHKFTNNVLLEFRHFIYDEYKYVSQYPNLYPRGVGQRLPQKRLNDTTVVHDLKLFQAFFAELENSNEIHCSPFRKLSREKRRKIMHVMYDEPIFLRAEEVKKVMTTKVPDVLQWVKDIFVLNCTIGCRIGDLLHLTLDKIATSEDGIPYIHYIPSKTTRLQNSNHEVMTPLINPALEIINRTELKLMGPNLKYGKERYNKNLRRLLEYCGISRRVSLYCQETKDNIYKPIYEVATSKLARKTHIDMLNKVQINYYAAGLHHPGSEAVFRYTGLELKDKYELIKAAFK